METLYAYLAGAIDADGRISISRDRGYRRGGREMAYYSAVISLSDSDSVLPDLLQETFPARRLQYEAKNRSHRAWHMWEAVGQKAQEPLIRLLPSDLFPPPALSERRHRRLAGRLVAVRRSPDFAHKVVFDDRLSLI
jgi:hypothetical protein